MKSSIVIFTYSPQRVHLNFTPLPVILSSEIRKSFLQLPHRISILRRLLYGYTASNRVTDNIEYCNISLFLSGSNRAYQNIFAIVIYFFIIIHHHYLFFLLHLREMGPSSLPVSGSLLTTIFPGLSFGIVLSKKAYRDYHPMSSPFCRQDS